ncbi:hypothetical protein AAES_24781 [Amazona aestiva]|uniref:Uncharacterized protein n=1 Tax=Amazona aestiva TaxID=12930 RepID=A0A0Q3TVD1_AMAAE|nr:hypothetical protein AAES_24781 [Amazona aestiva]
MPPFPVLSFGRDLILDQAISDKIPVTSLIQLDFTALIIVKLLALLDEMYFIPGKSQAQKLRREDVEDSLEGVQGANAVDVEVPRPMCVDVIAECYTKVQIENV